MAGANAGELGSSGEEGYMEEVFDYWSSMVGLWELSSGFFLVLGWLRGRCLEAEGPNLSGGRLVGATIEAWWPRSEDSSMVFGVVQVPARMVDNGRGVKINALEMCNSKGYWWRDGVTILVFRERWGLKKK